MPTFREWNGKALRAREEERLERDLIGYSRHRDGVPGKGQPKWRDWDWTMVAIIAVAVLVVLGFIALIVVGAIEKLG